jgi:predicted nucleic acid-binding protein
MTRYAIDAPTAVRMVREGITVPDSHQLVAPNVLRSQALSQIYRATRQGELSDDEAERMLEGITSMRIRLLGDRVSRRVAWRVASQLGWDDTPRAEYVAVAQLQADAFVTLDPDLARQVSDIVPVISFTEFVAALAS